MTRSCPICLSPDSTFIHSQSFTDGSLQEVSCCSSCGMVYASRSPEANYDIDSKYSVPDANGSGENPREQHRLDEVVELIASEVSDRSATILDIGCARGGLLEALRRAGYVNATGMDPSADCIAACHDKGLEAFQGTLDALPSRTYDLVVMSHVLEHVWDVLGALWGIRRRLNPEGKFYIEVPDASRYVDYLTVPFLDFNREHINHFSRLYLKDALVAAGLRAQRCDFREIEFSIGKYPAIWAMGGKHHGQPVRNESWGYDDSLCRSLTRYVARSRELMARIDDQLHKDLGTRSKVVLWGFGEFAQQLLKSTAVMQHVDVVQVVDHDPRKWGKKLRELRVEPPSRVLEGVPILVASIVNKESIVRDIERMGLSNPVVTI